MRRLTRRRFAQGEHHFRPILGAIRQYASENGEAPRYRDIGQIVGISSALVHRCLLDMRDRLGIVHFRSGCPRTIRVVEDRVTAWETAKQ